MKNNSPAEPLQAARAARASRTAELQNAEQFQANNAEKLKLREETGDLTDRAVLVEIGEMQTFDRLLPRRLDHLRACLESARKSEVEEANEFIRVKVSPRARQLEQRAREQARIALKTHFPDQHVLEHHVGQSALVLELQFAAPSISTGLTVEPERFSKMALEAWAKLDAIEAKLVA